MPTKNFEQLPLEFRRSTDARTWINASGYVCEYCPGHTKASSKNRGIFPQHRLEMEDYLGRELDDDEHVHHCNHDKTDNRIENLELVRHSDHLRDHMLKRHKTAPSKDPEVIERVLSAAQSGAVMKGDFVKDFEFSAGLVDKILKDHGVRWNSPYSKRLDPAYVEQVLRSQSRPQALKTLGCSVQHLWNHYPELMSMTSTRKLKKWGGEEDVSARPSRSKLPHSHQDASALQNSPASDPQE